MSDKENLKNDEQQVVSPEGRRSFLKKASIAAPIVVASSAKPAWAGGKTITCMSGAMSDNFSGKEPTCDLKAKNAKDCTYWRNKYVKHRTKTSKKKSDCNKLGVADYNQHYKFVGNYYFKASNKRWVNTGINKSNSMGSHTTIEQMLDSSDEFYQEIASALLNAKTCEKDINCIDYPYSSSEVIDIFTQVDNILDGSMRSMKMENVAKMLRGIRIG